MIMEMKNSVSTGIELLYRNKSLVNIPFDDDIVKEYNNAAFELDLEELVSKGNWTKDFNIPQYYKDINVKEYITRLIPASGQDVKIITERVDMELAEFEARNLFPVLQMLIYIIDTMRKNNLVWGVGRGSSVASYILYLMGVHKVDSVKYNLHIKEFLK
jgi:DNA polymerase III alpha subunit